MPSLINHKPFCANSIFLLKFEYFLGWKEITKTKILRIECMYSKGNKLFFFLIFHLILPNIFPEVPISINIRRNSYINF